MRLDWLGCATFRFVLGELVVYLDAYIDRVASAPKTGVTVAAVDRADWIVVGHSHFDHLWGAERIARQTGATIVGSYETVRVLEAQGVPMDQMMPVAGGERVKLSEDASVSVFASLHSCVWSQTRMSAADEVCLGDLGVTYQERALRLAQLGKFLTTLGPDTVRHLQQSDQHARGDGGALVYFLETRE